MQNGPGAASGWKAQAGALNQASECVASARSDITQQCHQLSTQIMSIGAGWGGAGAQAFHRVHSAWQEKQARIVRALDDFAESLGQTERDNTATDDARAAAAARLLSRLG